MKRDPVAIAMLVLSLVGWAFFCWVESLPSRLCIAVPLALMGLVLFWCTDRKMQV